MECRKHFPGTIVAVALLHLTAFCTAAEAGDSLARDMYYQQLSEPARSSNIGFRYWIELQRQGQTTRVSNRCRFRTGDKIKFHVSPNIDGYVHIVMIGGTSGNKSVLFPIPGKDFSNAVHRGNECTVPSTSFLQFDSTRGCEHLQVVLARRKLSNNELLRSGAPQVSIAASGVPTPATPALKVSFDDTPPAGAASSSDDTYIANAIPDEDNARDLFRSKEPSRPRPRPRRPHAIFTPYTTVVNTDANKDLYADISLEHD